MPIFDLYSKRSKKSQKSGDEPEIYIYDNFPNEFRVQFVHILNDTLGHEIPDSMYESDRSPSNQIWKNIFRILTKEYGLFHLYPDSETHQAEILNFFMKCDTLKALDVIEVSMRLVSVIRQRWGYPELERSQVKQSVESAIDELNQRFEEHQIGYEYQDGILVRKDTKFIHREVIKPALALLNSPDFAGAQEEFLNAYKYFRQGENKQAIAEASKAFESTMKVICTKRGFRYPSNATAIPLVKALLENGFISPELESQFAALRAALESGLPTIANKTSRHGQGVQPTTIGNHLVEFALNLCAANIVFLIKTYNESTKIRK